MTGRYNEVHLAGVSVAGVCTHHFFTLGVDFRSCSDCWINILARKNWIKIEQVMRQYLIIGVVLIALFVLGLLF